MSTVIGRAAAVGYHQSFTFAWSDDDNVVVRIGCIMAEHRLHNQHVFLADDDHDGDSVSSHPVETMSSCIKESWQQ